ncbi:MAG: GH3 auxin-responsive promoter family protein [Bacteroidales bacterium]
MSFLNSIASWYVKKRLSRINYFSENPNEVQDKVLKGLLQMARNTEWGKNYEFKTIDSYKTFSERLPIQDYDNLKPTIERMLKGEQNILWPTDIKWFAKSSGTTADRSKFIPISRESLSECHYMAGKDVLAIFCQNHPEHRIFDGKGLIMGGSNNLSKHNKHISVGDLSAVLLRNIPFYGEFFHTPDLSLALIENWEEKLDKIAHATYAQNVTNMSGVPSWNLILLKHVLEITGRNHILEVWPNLKLFIHGGVNFAPYRSQFEKLIPSPHMVYLETYNASEGFFGIQDRQDTKDMLLMLDYGIFYEFIPIEELEEDNPGIISLSEVDTNTNYAMVITTNGGLWRYLIGDTVRFTSLSPYRIRISGRTKSFINAFGEEVIVDNTDSALQKACDVTGAVISEYTAAPVYLDDNQTAAHEYVIEFEKEPSDLDRFTAILDQELQNLNSDYAAKRSADLMLKKPKLTSVPSATFFNWLKSKGRVGGQNKVPRLFNGRRYVDDILGFIGKPGH